MHCNHYTLLLVLYVTLSLLLQSIGAQTTRCGSTWADANGKCGTACPGAVNSQCPNGETCFTDLAITPCTSRQQQNSSSSVSPNAECSATKPCPIKACCSKWGFCGWTEEFCNSECLSNCEMNPRPSQCDESKKMKVNWGYYQSWAASRACTAVNPASLDASLYSHLAFSFAQVSEDFKLVPTSSNDSAAYQEFNKLKQSKQYLKTIIAVGGWAFNDPPTQTRFTNMAASAESRNAFVQSAVEFLQTHGFDGLDIDWEYPGAPDRGGRPEDVQNLVSLVTELRQEFNKHGYLLTLAVPISNWYLRHFDLENIHPQVDWFNLMSYDIHGVWDANIPSLGPYVQSHTNITEIKLSLNMFYKNGVPLHKLVLGLGAYGRSFTLADPTCSTPGCTFSGAGKPGPCTQSAGTLAYFEIQDLITKGSASDAHFDAGSFSNYLIQGDQWISYDDTKTFTLKNIFARNACMRGLMLWAADMLLTGINGTLSPASVKSCTTTGAVQECCENEDKQKCAPDCFVSPTDTSGLGIAAGIAGGVGAGAGAAALAGGAAAGAVAGPIGIIAGLIGAGLAIASGAVSANQPKPCSTLCCATVREQCSWTECSTDAVCPDGKYSIVTDEATCSILEALRPPWERFSKLRAALEGKKISRLMCCTSNPQ